MAPRAPYSLTHQQHHYFRSYLWQSRLPLSLLFFLVVALSVVLTLFSINENLHVRQMLRIMTSDALKNRRTLEPIEIDTEGAALGRAGSSGRQQYLKLTTANDSWPSPLPPLPRHHHIIDRKRLKGILKLKKFKSKLLMLKGGPFFWHQNGSQQAGWKLLPGSIVVPDGDAHNPHSFTYVTNAAEACLGLESGTKKGGSSRVSVLIFIESDVRNADRRQVIRQTWGLPLLQRALNYRVVFMLGLARSRETQAIVQEEFYAYGDVVQENFTESFKHLTLKSVMGLKWALRYCHEADYIMKTDDDILVHVPNLVRMLQRRQEAGSEGGSTSNSSILCRKNRSRQIVRRGPQMVKYQVSAHELPGSFFPDYCGGFAYVMSADVAHALYEASTHIPYFFIEDVYVTGFCRHRAGIQLLDHPDIALRPHVTGEQGPCHFAEGRITSQELGPDEMKSVWQSLNTRGFFCPVPIATTSAGRSDDAVVERNSV